MKTVGLFAYGETGCAALLSLFKKYNVSWVILPPDTTLSPQVRKQVEILARKNRIPIVKTNSSKVVSALLDSKKVSAVVISSYNKILKNKILQKSKFINVHHGKLPEWRGRANINWAIILDKKEIGLTFHEATENLDSGNIYKQFVVPIENTDTVKTVYDKFNKIIEMNTAKVVEEVLRGFTGSPQKGKATYCSTRLPQDGYIDWNLTTREIYNVIRALTKPYPGAFTYYNGKKLIVWDSEVPKNPNVYEGRIPGRVVQIHPNGVEVLTADSSILIKNVLYNGKEAGAQEIITSIKSSLGINFVEFYEKIMKEK